LTIVVGLGILFLYYAYAPIPHLKEPHYITVQPGDTVRSLAERLTSQGTEDRKKLFILAGRILGVGLHLKTGTYLIEPGMTPKQIYDLLSSGKSVARRLTIPEGFNIYQIDALLTKEGLIESNEFIALVTDPELIKQLNIPNTSLEGYLFPDTYFWGGSYKLKDFVNTMLTQFNTVWTSDWSKRANELGLTKHKVLTLASIIEKETGKAEERALVSSVFHNRLRRGMLLQADPTVVYGVKNYNGTITKKQLRTKTPYNTYMISGLPPGPICNPGKDAILAALYPANTNYLYFVAKNDSGFHVFTKTYAEHNVYVKLYQR